MKSFFSDFQPEKRLTPSSAEEVQEIIQKANRDKTPLVPVSSGTNLQDTHLPSVKGATAVDLSGLKGIYFDSLNRNVVVEPGVTFADVEKHCSRDKLRVLTAIDVPKTASVLSSYLEMLPLYDWPKYHPWEMLTMEGYRADGHRFATGQMAMSQDRPDKYSWGVSFAMVARLYCQAQGTLGIITKAAVTLKTAMPQKEVLYYPCANIGQAAKALKAFIATEEPHEIFAVNKVYFADLLGEKPSAGMPAWTVVLVNRGADKNELAYKKQDMAVIAKTLGGRLLTGITGAKHASDTILSEIKTPTGPGLHTHGSGWAPIVSIATAQQLQKSAGLFPKNSGAIVMPLQSGACFYYQADLRYAEDGLAKTRKQYADICSKLLKDGVMFPRPSALIARQVAGMYSDNFKVLKAIKKAVDPNNIMNPGKLGL
ncbi:MAG: FAD-binding oxidoreductase [Pseudomonadota bacterium]